ncbi:MAG: hypothetical protein QOD73_2047, partial [Solirubrobacteraceae bacterium]|nr:hypothetical protein [Solirubrobacteraceae bacterium]
LRRSRPAATRAPGVVVLVAGVCRGPLALRAKRDRPEPAPARYARTSPSARAHSSVRRSVSSTGV